MKKKILIVFLLIAVISLTGCGKKKEKLKDDDSSKTENTGIDCKFDGELVRGAEYVNGQYTYHYKEKSDYDDWEEIDEDGWGVILTDKKSTLPVTTKLCKTVNGKPIVNMDYMFYRSDAESIDLKSFDTSKVTSMNSMFSFTEATSLDLSSFNTSNVIDMFEMFYNSDTTVLDLSGFDTSKVTDMSGMFIKSKATTIDVSNFDVSNVERMSRMFCHNEAFVNNKINYGSNPERFKAGTMCDY